MSHFRRKITSPVAIMSVAYCYVGINAVVFYFSGFYSSSTFFAWGPPIKFFGQDIISEKNFYLLLLIVFFHQIVNNCVNSIVYPWIMNSVQDPKNREMEYSHLVSILLINFFDIYSQLDVIFIVMGFISQISFVCVVMIANAITSTYINFQYLKAKRRDISETSPLMEISSNNL
jgi:hypothetical protein